MASSIDYGYHTPKPRLNRMITVIRVVLFSFMAAYFGGVPALTSEADSTIGRPPPAITDRS